MTVGLRNTIRIGSISASGAVALLFLSAASPSAQLAVPIPPETLNWNGDPKAPDISGVWVRAEGPTGPLASKEGWLPWPPPLKPGFAEIWRKRVADAALGDAGE